MFARITRAEGAPDRLTEAAAIFEQRALPALRQQAGFVGAIVLADGASGTALSVSYWASEAALRASEQGADVARAQTIQAMGARVVDVDRFELVIWERTAPPEAHTFVRINDIRGASDKIDAGIGFVREQVVPALRQSKGFRAVIMGVNRESGRVFVSTVWESAADREASDAGLVELRRQGGQTLGATEVKVEQYEAVFVELNVPATVNA